MDSISKLIQGVTMPHMARVRQHLPHSFIEDVPTAIRSALSAGGLTTRIHKGMRIAIPCGSRGINNIAIILREIATFCKELGATPFIFPAMGSHGGATSEGQREVLNSLGVTEKSLGCPIISSMETVVLGEAQGGYPVYLDRAASDADGIIVVGRIKAHTAFRGSYESGLMKMMAVGMGNKDGAESCHVTGFRLMHEIVPVVATAMLKNAPVLMGVALIENAYEQTCLIKGLSSDEIPNQEPELLKHAKQLMGRIYLPETDLLIVDRIGKNISGDGADPNITGGFCGQYASGGLLASKRIALDLTEETQGNAMGIGMFDATTQRLFSKIDFVKTYINPIVSTSINMVRIPMIMNSDRDAVALCLKTSPDIDHANPRIIRICDTQHVDEILISKAHLEEVIAHPKMELSGSFLPIPFDDNGNLF